MQISKASMTSKMNTSQFGKMRDLRFIFVSLIVLKFLVIDQVVSLAGKENTTDDGFVQPRGLRSPLALASVSKDDKHHVVILSNRLVATAVAIGSVCRTSKKKVHFHIYSTDDTEFHEYFNKLPDCQGSVLELKSIDQATDELLARGFEPIWWQVEQKEKAMKQFGLQENETGKREWGVQTPYTNKKHAHALNLLRFYLPHLPSLEHLEKFVFLDDDVVLKRDLGELLDYKMQDGIAMLAGCQHWMWNGNVKGNFETKWNMTVLETAYIGNHAEVCDPEKEQPYGCLRKDLDKDISLVSQLLDPESKFAANPLDRQAFNMGLNVYDVKAWKELKLSHRFEQWVDASHNLRLFPLDTLAFGLCLAYLSMGDTVQCYEPGPITHLVGMAFVTEESYEVAGWPLDKINKDSYALHYNGAHKPWEDVKGENECSTDTPTSILDMWKKTCEDVGICTCKKGIIKEDKKVEKEIKEEMKTEVEGTNNKEAEGTVNKESGAESAT